MTVKANSKIGELSEERRAIHSSELLHEIIIARSIALTKESKVKIVTLKKDTLLMQLPPSDQTTPPYRRWYHCFD